MNPKILLQGTTMKLLDTTYFNETFRSEKDEPRFTYELKDFTLKYVDV